MTNMKVEAFPCSWYHTEERHCSEITDCFSPVCTMAAEAAAPADPADVPGLLQSEAGRVHEQVLHHSGTVLLLHTGELCMSTSGEFRMCASKGNKSFPVQIQVK